MLSHLQKAEVDLTTVGASLQFLDTELIPSGVPNFRFADDPEVKVLRNAFISIDPGKLPRSRLLVRIAFKLKLRCGLALGAVAC